MTNATKERLHNALVELGRPVTVTELIDRVTAEHGGRRMSLGTAGRHLAELELEGRAARMGPELWSQASVPDVALAQPAASDPPARVMALLADGRWRPMSALCDAMPDVERSVLAAVLVELVERGEIERSGLTPPVWRKAERS
jgi:hypothetical protein